MKVQYPLVVRPSYVLGGRAMEIVYNDDELETYMTEAVKVSNKSPVLLDHFLNKAIEVDIDAVCDGEDILIGGLMEHICLLYTSPSPRDRQKSRMPSSA